MRIIKGKAHSKVSVMFVIALIGLIIYKGYPAFGLFPVFLLVLFMFFVYWLVTFPGHYYFSVYDTELIIKNTFNPFIRRIINLKRVDVFKKINTSYYGNALQIIFKSRSKKIYPINMKSKDLEKVIEELNSLLK